MSRGVRDLRELVCVSRLTYRDSDEEDEVWSDEDRVGKELSKLELSDGSSSPGSRSSSEGAHPLERLLSPDSGFVTNGSPVDKSESATGTGIVTNGSPVDKSEGATGPAAPKAAEGVPKGAEAKPRSKSKPSKRKRKKAALQALSSQHDLPKLPLLPPVQNENYLFQDTCSPPDGPEQMADARGGRDCQTRRGDFDAMLTYMDATIVAEWLTRSNTALEDMTTYCSQGDNFVQFAHFWLSEFPDTQKQEIYEMEHEILVEEVGLAFAVGKESRKVVRRDVTDLVSALFREYPTKLFSSRGTHLFLSHLDILTSDRTERYKKLLADVRCSTKNRQYAQWLLATRSFALVSMWSAIVNFYRNLLGQHGIPPGLPVPAFSSSGDSVYQRRLLQAVR